MSVYLHEKLKDMVDQMGRDVLTSEHLPGYMADALIFRSRETKDYRSLLLQMAERGDIGSICALDPWDAQAAKNIESAVSTAYRGNANVEYAVSSIGYALGRISDVPNIPSASGRSSGGQEYRLSEEAMPYVAHGSNNLIGTLIPTCMAADVHACLDEIEKEEGSVIQYVMDEMYESSQQEIENKISGEQIDGVAMAIRQMNRGRGFILGDMTGVGKGRQLAMLLKWARLQGCKPVFVTEKSVLFRDIYRDLQDVGYADLRPFILNSDKEAIITDDQGNEIYGLPSSIDMDEFQNKGVIPAGYDLLLLTYSQVNKEKGSHWKIDAVLSAIKDSYLILDESHNATGTDSNTGIFFREAVQNALGVCFSSATYAKYPASMPIYALKTAMGDANISAQDLLEIIMSGGPILQEVMAKGLVASGSMVRRQRDMKGVEYSVHTLSNPQQCSIVKSRYDIIIRMIQEIRDFEIEHISPYLSSIKAAAVISGAYKMRKNEVLKKGRVDYAKFATRMIPAIRQLLFAIKAEQTVEVVIEELKKGRKPIVQIARTMESTIAKLSQIDPSFPKAEFGLSLIDYVHGMFSYKAKATSEQTVGKNKVSRNYQLDCTFTIDDLDNYSPGSKDAYQNLITRIKAIDSGLPLSPIDYFVQRLEAEGYKVGEITQRSYCLRYDDVMAGGNSPAKYIKRDKHAKKTLADAFNAGGVDVLIGNRVMSAGISLHNSRQFADQRQRVMITWEQQESADVQLQFNGRADRTGQLTRCAYIRVSSPLPAEQRFTMMNSRKQLSLYANIEAVQKTDHPCTDIINEYGAEVVMEYLRENPEYNDLFEFAETPDYIKTLGRKKKNGLNPRFPVLNRRAKIINGFMRGLCLLDSAEQETILTEVVKRYESYVEYLDSIGENNLVTKAKPLEAALITRGVFCKGNDNSPSAFARDAKLEEVEVNVLRKPMTADEIVEFRQTLCDASTVETELRAYQDEKATGIKRYYKGLQLKADAQIAALKAQTPGSYRPSRLAQLEKRAHNGEAMLAQLKAVEEATNEVIKLLNIFSPMQSVGIPMLIEERGVVLDPDWVSRCVSMGLFLGYKMTSSKATPSSIKAIFAVNDSRRIIEIPLSRYERLLAIKTQSTYGLISVKLQKVSIQTWDSLIPKSNREKSYIITGNIIMGIAKARKLHLKVADNRLCRQVAAMCSGQMINYTDTMGRIRTGYQLSQFFNPKLIQKYIS